MKRSWIVLLLLIVCGCEGPKAVAVDPAAAVDRTPKVVSAEQARDIGGYIQVAQLGEGDKPTIFVLPKRQRAYFPEYTLGALVLDSMQFWNTDQITVAITLEKNKEGQERWMVFITHP